MPLFDPTPQSTGRHSCLNTNRCMCVCMSLSLLQNRCVPMTWSVKSAWRACRFSWQTQEQNHLNGEKICWRNNQTYKHIYKYMPPSIPPGRSTWSRSQTITHSLGHSTTHSAQLTCCSLLFRYVIFSVAVNVRHNNYRQRRERRQRKKWRVWNSRVGAGKWKWRWWRRWYGEISPIVTAIQDMPRHM